MDNPFIVHTPEQLSAADIASIFVEIYTDFPKLKEPNNMFIHGARGTGKSIMLRSLEQPVQELLPSSDHEDLPFFAIHVPIKDVFFGNPEFQRLKGWKSTTVGEHLLSVHLAHFLFQGLSTINDVSPTDILTAFSDLWRDCGGDSDLEKLASCTSFSDLAQFCDRETSRVRQYYVRLPDDQEPDIYTGALASFNDLVLPLAKSIKTIDRPVAGRPICFMVDDADNLPEAMQRVLNSWISTRTAHTICFKVTTQLGYATYKTVDNRIIESPHDFSEVNIGTVYTSHRGIFAKRIEAIVQKRLENAKIEASAKTFFPQDSSQEKRRREIWEDLMSGESGPHVSLKGSGPSRNRDLAQRYTIPALMRELRSGRSSHTFSYAGLQSVIDLSSGVVRWFLEPAWQMFQRVWSTDQHAPSDIPVGVQDSVISEWATSFREKLNVDPGDVDEGAPGASLQSSGHTRANYQKLGNLLDGIGNFCRARLLDNTASEQRVFSFVLSDNPDKELSNILHLGVRLGYLQKSDLASKSAFRGRRPRYILSRRLGPYYQLDISGYAAHLSVTCAALKVAINSPRDFVQLRQKGAMNNDLQSTLSLGDSS